jgi:membrane-bound ClpP family serine protease
MYPLKTRFMIAGSFVFVIGVVLIVVRGFAPLLLVLPIVGGVVLVVGLLWPRSKDTNSGGEENKPGVW